MPLRSVIAPGAVLLACSLLPAAAATGDSDRAPVPMCAGKRATVVGTSGDDTIDVGQRRRPQVIVAKGGDDLVYGTLHNDRICGGAGDDTLYELGGSDIIKAGTGWDEIPDGGKRIVAGTGNDRISLQTGERSTVFGGRGTDTLWNGERNDTCRSIERWRYSHRGC
jgi:Ca2+-binding RTX toxin-like protein